jgi:hypothetical protein
VPAGAPLSSDEKIRVPFGRLQRGFHTKMLRQLFGKLHVFIAGRSIRDAASPVEAARQFKPNGVIYRAPLDKQAEPGRREVFYQFEEGEGIPDGAAMDVEGCYWSALFDGWRIARFSPLGEQLEEYHLPVRCPTMVCFGGADMKTLFITTTRENMSAQELKQYPLSGAIFTLPVNVAGMKKSRFIER